MIFERILFKTLCTIGDRWAQRPMNVPETIERCENISYGPHGKWNLLDVFYPKGTDRKLPTIINIHGGGYVYGTKDVYKFYCMDLALRGFTVVSFNYRLAPEISFPEPVVETNLVMKWVCANAEKYFIDTGNIFFVGDSAGAQIASQYCAAVMNPVYAQLFDLEIPEFNIKAMGLNCGMYDNLDRLGSILPGLMENYFGKDPAQFGERIKVLKYINSNYPPTFVMSAGSDFLLPHAKPMHDFLTDTGIECQLKIYGNPKQKDAGHVFHVNILSPLAKECNDDECQFFKKHVS